MTTAMAAPAQQGYLVTIDTKNTLRLFSAIQSSKSVAQVGVKHTFDETPLGVAVHPNGYSLVVGFEKRLVRADLCLCWFECLVCVGLCVCVDFCVVIVCVCVGCVCVCVCRVCVRVCV